MTKNLAPGKFDVVGSFLRPEILKKLEEILKMEKSRQSA